MRTYMLLISLLILPLSLPIQLKAEVYSSHRLRLEVSHSYGKYDEYGRKYDEYGEIPFEEEKERLGQFLKQLSTEPKAKGFIFIFTKREDQNEVAQARARRVKNYLVNELKVNSIPVIFIESTDKQSLISTELWVFPPDVPDDIYKAIQSDPNKVRVIRQKSRGAQ